MIVWSGKGILILVFFNIFFWGMIFLTSLEETDSITSVIACYATAIVSFILGRKWNTETYMSAFENQKNPKVPIIPLSTLFWVRMEYWFWILLVIGSLIWMGVFG